MKLKGIMENNLKIKFSMELFSEKNQQHVQINANQHKASV
jgi:hypothetical protein